MKTNLTLTLIVLFFVCSCKQKIALKSIDNLHGPYADTFNVGCSFYESGKDKVLIFASDFDSTAYVSTNGSAVEFRLVKNTSIELDDSTANFIDEYKSGDYYLKVQMNMKNDHPTDEAYYEGTIIVTDKQGKKISKKVAGECGC